MNEHTPDNGPLPTGPRIAGPAPGVAPGDGPQFRVIDLLLVLAITASLYFLVGALIEDPARTVGFVIAMLAVQNAIPMAAVYLVVVQGRGLAWADLGFRPPPSSRWYLRAVLIALLALPAIALVNLLVQAVADRPFRNPQLEVLAPEGFTWIGLAGMLVMVGVVAPIVEELVFRGLLYGWLRRRLGVWTGAGLSALAFAVAHGIAMLIPALFVIGLILARVYERSGSLWPPIVVHGTFNAIMTVLLYTALAAGVALD